MRIVLALDMSPGSDRALALVARQEWPPGTLVRIVTSAVGIGQQPSSFAGPRQWRSHARHVHAAIEAAHVAAAETLGRVVRVETAVLDDSPAAAVLADARAFDADLVVVGSHGHDPISATFVGSVSSEIARDASCSVLVVKVDSDERLLLATDGSAPAELAARMTAQTPLFRHARVRVIAIASDALSYTDQVLGGDAAQPVAALDAVDPGVREHAESLAGDLAAAGRDVDVEVRVGEPAAAIIAAAREWPADVVVVGARGASMLRRLLLGSVASSVLNGTQASVLIARERPVATPGG